MNPLAATSRSNPESASGSRLGFLKSTEATNKVEGEPLFVVVDESDVARCENGPAFRDVRYARVIRRESKGTATKDVRPTISYSLAVAGTDLIYDVTGEFLQGKARPFACDLSRESERIYVVLPFQMEIIAVVAEKRTFPDNCLAVRVEFQQASGERIVGKLPFQLRLLAGPGHVAHESWRATDASGVFSDLLHLPKNGVNCRWTLVVRSQLDGQEASVEIV